MKYVILFEKMVIVVGKFIGTFYLNVPINFLSNKLLYCLLFFSLGLIIFRTLLWIYCLLQLGMAMGWGGAEGWDLRPCPASRMDFLAPSPPCPAWRKNFLPHSCPLRPHEDSRSPTLPRKTLFFINFLYNYYHFFK